MPLLANGQIYFVIGDRYIEPEAAGLYAHNLGKLMAPTLSLVIASLAGVSLASVCKAWDLHLRCEQQ